MMNLAWLLIEGNLVHVWSINEGKVIPHGIEFMKYFLA